MYNIHIAYNFLNDEVSMADSIAESIEQGGFILTMMPSLRCSLNCPHCYLSEEERRSSQIMTLSNMAKVCEKIGHYYQQKELANKTIVCYWYGGEPTDMGQDYLVASFKLINKAFPSEQGYQVKHVVLSSLININPSWFDIFHEYCGGEIQTSFDWLMRGKGYIRQWEKSMRAASQSGLRISTISVMNKHILEFGPQKILQYMTDLNIAESGWLPFMWNDENELKKVKNGKTAYQEFAPTMDAYSTFMVELTKQYHTLKSQGLSPPEIGPRRFVFTQMHRGGLANIAGQTLFLMPNGDFSLPDYRNGYQEYMRPFGNILEQSFEEILTSPARRAYLRKQLTRNGNKECLSCQHADKCMMEFWKDNRPNDDCFGAKRYVNWLLDNDSEKPVKIIC
jgi:sulfatase maturation enzyme AslB (radical SAM superfamily)